MGSRSQQYNILCPTLSFLTEGWRTRTNTINLPPLHLQRQIKGDTVDFINGDEEAGSLLRPHRCCCLHHHSVGSWRPRPRCAWGISPITRCSVCASPSLDDAGCSIPPFLCGLLLQLNTCCGICTWKECNSFMFVSSFYISWWVSTSLGLPTVVLVLLHLPL